MIQSALSTTVRVSTYPLRIRQPARQLKSKQSTMTEELYELDSFVDAMQSADTSQWEAASKISIAR
jgi:hypothetical protein